MIDSNHARWHAIASTPGVGARTLYTLQDQLGDPADVLRASASALGRAGVSAEGCSYLQSLRSRDIDDRARRLLELELEFIWHSDREFPAILREIADPPACLYRRGQAIQPLSGVAVVGSRRASPYGRQVARELTEPLAAAGITIVSGLAFGIDAIAHQATLDVGGYTIAVLGHGLHDIYPPSHRALAREIVAKGGTLLSEFPPGMPALRHHFPIRNRIVAGMTLGTVVVEAALDSGALITAKLALEYSREVFAVPGPITSEVSAGPNALLRVGAIPITSAADVITELNLEDRHNEAIAREIVPDSPLEAAVLAKLSRSPISLDDLVRQTKLEPASVSSTLLLMEMKGRVRNLGAQRYVRR